MSSKTNNAQKWKLEYDSEKKERALVCATFHMKWRAEDKNKLTYKRIAKRVIDDPDTVLSRKQYVKLCNNRLSQIILKENYTPPKFKRGDLVAFDASTPFIREIGGYLNTKIKGLVIECVGEITKPMRGSKKYRVLPTGMTTIIRIEEKYLVGNKKWL